MISVDDLRSQSGLPGPRANLALLHRFMREGDAATAAECLKYARAGVSNSPDEFLAMCGVLASAYQRRSDIKAALAFLRPYAAHASWRVRECVAIALQEAFSDFLQTLPALEDWIDGTALEQRAVVAGICEPRLLKNPRLAAPVLSALSRITASFDSDEKLDDALESLRKTLGYGWSVAVAAFPEVGKLAFEALFVHRNKHLRWILLENLKKNRLTRMDADWVEQCKLQLS